MKKSTILGSLFLSAILITSVFVFAMPNTHRVPATNNKSGVQVQIPSHAVEIAEGVFDLGFASDPASGELVQGYAIVKFKDKQAKGGKKGKPSSGNSCYSFLASGAKWKVQENYSVDPTNTRGLNHATIKSIINGNIENWETAAGNSNIFGSEVAGSDFNLGLDGKNEVFFADVDSPGAIAITEVWGIFSGKPKNRRLVEWNMVFDDVDFDWSAEAVGIVGKMDFDNIGNHEMGHAFGMGHSGSCTDETMYAYSTEGETKKRSLEAGDIAGIISLYA
jgi:hypothetical protein